MVIQCSRSGWTTSPQTQWDPPLPPPDQCEYGITFGGGAGQTQDGLPGLWQELQVRSQTEGQLARLSPRRAARGSSH